MTVYYLVEFLDENNAIGITRSEWVRPTGCTTLKEGHTTFKSWPLKDHSNALRSENPSSVNLHKKVYRIKIKRASGTSSVSDYTVIQL